MLLTSAKKASGLKIRAGQRTMSGQDNHLSGQTVSPQKGNPDSGTREHFAFVEFGILCFGIRTI